MSNDVIPNFLPPPYDFTTEENEDYTEEEDEDYTEEENENTCAYKIFYGIIFALVVYRLIGPKIKIDLKVSIH